jgi:hypothetical protein
MLIRDFAAILLDKDRFRCRRHLECTQFSPNSCCGQPGSQNAVFLEYNFQKELSNFCKLLKAICDKKWVEALQVGSSLRWEMHLRYDGGGRIRSDFYV